SRQFTDNCNPYVLRPMIKSRDLHRFASDAYETWRISAKCLFQCALQVSEFFVNSRQFTDNCNPYVLRPMIKSRDLHWFASDAYETWRISAKCLFQCALQVSEFFVNSRQFTDNCNPYVLRPMIKSRDLHRFAS